MMIPQVAAVKELTPLMPPSYSDQNGGSSFAPKSLRSMTNIMAMGGCEFRALKKSIVTASAVWEIRIFGSGGEVGRLALLFFAAKWSVSVS